MSGFGDQYKSPPQPGGIKTLETQNSHFPLSLQKEFDVRIPTLAGTSLDRFCSLSRERYTMMVPVLKAEEMGGMTGQCRPRSF